MRIIITQNMTLDGRVEMLDDWFDPQARDEELSAELMRQSANEDVLLLGGRPSRISAAIGRQHR